MFANGVRKAAMELLSELDGSRLQVCKIRNRDGDGYVRCVISENAEWYQRLCREHEQPRSGRYRKWRTVIRRCHVRRALIEVASGRKETLYAHRVFKFCVERANEMSARRRTA